MALLVVPPDNSCRINLKDPGDRSVKELRGAIAWAGLGRMAVGLAEKLEFVNLLEGIGRGSCTIFRRVYS